MEDLNNKKKDEMVQLTPVAHDVAIFVSQCSDVKDDQLKTFLSQHIDSTRRGIAIYGEEHVKKYVHILTKSLRKKSKQAEALRYYYYGYFIRQQEELIENHRKNVAASTRTILASKKHYMDVLCYLFKCGCMQPKDISSSLALDKSNLNRIMNNLVENDLVTKSVGPRCVFFELSSSGYSFVREHSLLGNVSLKAGVVSPLENRIESFKIEYADSTSKKDGRNYKADLKNLSYETMIDHVAHYDLFEAGRKKYDPNTPSKHKEKSDVLEVKVDIAAIGMIVEKWGLKEKDHGERAENIALVGGK